MAKISPGRATSSFRPVRTSLRSGTSTVATHVTF